MFSLWYSLLAWKEYKKNKLATKPTSQQNSAEETKSKQEVPNVELEPVKSFDPKTNQLPSVPQIQPQSTPKPVSSPQNTIIETSFPGTMQNSPIALMDPPVKPPRSPSPHPIRTEVYDIEFDSEESEEDDDEDEEQNSVIASNVADENHVAPHIEEYLSSQIFGIKKESS
ncbi:uncharacterized protein LOC123322025 [Coccinella septempunctata]|uniref:uncharacterized protein LOC123322025 n=1 Tax=Coccinella septempunctata TaxID=41139 RepID=UPI001D074B2E|nr:uncharacterized protein LOC123322025 [Coccinella septempunctata]